MSSAATVHVSNISHNTTESELSSFFSFCGKIVSLTLTPSTADPDASLSATITFERESAAKTACLLDGTPLNSVPLTVNAAHSIDEIAGDHLAPNANIGPDGEIPQEEKPRSAIFAEYLANGYVIGDTALQKGLELDQKHGISSRFAAALTNALTTIDAKTHASDRAKSMEAQYHLTEKAAGAASGLGRYFEKAVGGTGAVQKLRQFYQAGEKQLFDIHAEAKRLAEMKKEKKRQSLELGKTADGNPFVGESCQCGGEAGSCSCEPGKCTCQGCAKAGGAGEKEEAEKKAGIGGQVEHALTDVKGTTSDAAVGKV